MRHVFLTWEYNAYESDPNVASVWLSFDDPRKEGASGLGTRIVGPIPIPEADAILQQLQTAFEGAGDQVTRVDCADD